jgi:hypothetical protein
MRFAAVILVLLSCANAQVVRGPRRGPARDSAAQEGPSPESLLRIVHDDAQQLSPTDRATVLARAIQSAQRVEPDLVLSWTEELFNLAPQISEDRRASVEMSPVIAVASRDIETALRLLERMDAPSKSMLDSGNDPRIAAAGSLFSQYWGRSGRPRLRNAEPDDEDDDRPASKQSEQAKKLDRVRSIASRFGASGVYPYSAFTAPLETLKRDDPAAQETLYADLLTAFRSSPARYADVLEFIRMLTNSRGMAPPALFREALTMAVAAVDRIPVDTLPTMSFTFRAQGTSGQLNSAASLQLMRLIPLIREVDPAWAKQVLEQHPDLAQFEQARNGYGTVIGTASAMGASGTGAARTPQRQLAPVRATASNSTETAKMFANAISDPAARAAANAEIAAGLAAQSPQEAGTYLNQASEGLAKVDDPTSQLMVVTSLARAAFETGDRASAEAYSERGFRLGEDVVRADYDANPDKPMMSLKGVSDLSSLVTTSMRIDPAATVVRIQAIRYPLLRANLLLTAVDAVGARRNIRGTPMRVVGGIDAVQVLDSAQSEAAARGTTVQSVTVETRHVAKPVPTAPVTPPQ